MYIVLDTSVARGLAYDVGAQLAALKQARDLGHTVHLADSTPIELLSQVAERRIAWPEWVRARRALCEVLDPQDPVFAGGWEALDKGGIRLDRTLDASEHDSRRATRRDGWHVICAASDPGDLERLRFTHRRGEFRSAHRHQAALNVRDEVRNDWADDMLGVGATVGGPVPTFGEVFAGCAANLDAKAISVPPASVRLDAFLRVCAHFAVLRLKRKTPYNPVKNANDAIDVDLLRYLALPAIVCTNDGRLRRVVEQCRSWQAPWLVPPQDLDAALQFDSALYGWNL